MIRFLALLACTVGLAGGSASAAAGEDAVRAALGRVAPNATVQSVAESVLPGLFEVALDGRVVYVSADGRYLVGGPLIDANSGVNLTQERLDVLNAIPWKSLPLDAAIKRVKGNGSRHIAIFEDPDCPYCKALEATLREVDDVTIHVLLYPLASLHPEATAKSKAIWCAKDPAAAWEEAMKSGAIPPDPKACDAPIARIAEFAARHRITGTPTTILLDGRRVVGAVPRAELERRLTDAGKAN